ncbi:phosphate/phosphite/phosphonate ABC transporter substrate-binding protein [Azonexus sp.]|uniref:phosphate/phosphite/phosphonate ABC transporter substrate-binding protein n=1 Tax=Azonexus sp. TaxID=1872668 RepID=UPI0039E255F4
MSAVLPRICSFLLMLFLGSHTAFADPPPLKLGVMPFNSPQALARSLQGLTTHLEQQLGRKIILYTAPNYKTHIQQLLAGEFDIAITGPHFAAMAEEQSMRILFRYAEKLEPVLVLPANSPPLQVAQLRGKTIATASRFAIITLGSLEWLEKNGLELGKDYTLQEYPSHGAAIAAVANHMADAAFVAASALQQNPEEIKQAVRTQEIGIFLPHVCTLLNRTLDPASAERITQALSDFPHTEAGKAFFQQTGYAGYAPLSAADRVQLRRYIGLTKHLLELP